VSNSIATYKVSKLISNFQTLYKVKAVRLKLSLENGPNNEVSATNCSLLQRYGILFIRGMDLRSTSFLGIFSLLVLEQYPSR
jgi:hypothetical protein